MSFHTMNMAEKNDLYSGLKLLQYYANIIDKFWSKRTLCTSNVSYLPYHIPLLSVKMIFADLLSRILPQIGI